MNDLEREVSTLEETRFTNTKLSTHNKEMMDSMHYASFIQKGILPQERHLNRLFSEHFVMYRPQNIIGGDLYWVCQKNNLKIFAVGDCTGHGVSGAMLSVLAVSFLNYLVLGKDFLSIGKVLEELDKKWIETFDQGLNRDFNNDWLEIGICAFNSDTRELQFAGAFNKLVYIHQGKETIIEGNRYPIGGWQLEKNREFTDYSMVLPEDSMVYMHSDGFKDQFGSKTRKRFGNNRFMGLLKSTAHLPIVDQYHTIEEEFLLWKGTEQQTDDVCLMGIRL
jgi:sigma-B regulation protein RsbU (phosphoserine phosphatase)